MGKQRGEVFWSRHVVAAAGSGLSKAAYCRRHSINRKTFYRWVARVGVNPVDPLPTQSLVPLSVATSPMPGPEALGLQLGTGVVLTMPRSVDARWLAELLRALASC